MTKKLNNENGTKIYFEFEKEPVIIDGVPMYRLVNLVPRHHNDGKKYTVQPTVRGGYVEHPEAFDVTQDFWLDKNSRILGDSFVDIEEGGYLEICDATIIDTVIQCRHGVISSTYSGDNSWSVPDHKVGATLGKIVIKNSVLKGDFTITDSTYVSNSVVRGVDEEDSNICSLGGACHILDSIVDGGYIDDHADIVGSVIVDSTFSGQSHAVNSRVIDCEFSGSSEVENHEMKGRRHDRRSGRKDQHRYAGTVQPFRYRVDNARDFS